MKIVFKDSLIDVLIKRIHEGKCENKTVEYILLTEEECCDLKHDRRYFQYCDGGMHFVAAPSVEMRDAKFHTIQLQDPDARNDSRVSPYRTFPSFMKFMGVPVYVVPARFM